MSVYSKYSNVTIPRKVLNTYISYKFSGGSCEIDPQEGSRVVETTLPLRGAIKSWTTQDKHPVLGYWRYLPYESRFWETGTASGVVNNTYRTHYLFCGTYPTSPIKVIEEWSCTVSPVCSFQGYGDTDFHFNKLKIAVAKRIKDRSAILGVTYQEREKTFSQLTSLVKQTFKATRAFTRGDLKGFATALGYSKDVKKNIDNTASKWLGFRYGLTPTFLDVVGIAEQAAKAQLAKEKYIFHTATTTVKSTILSTDSGRADQRYYNDYGALRYWPVWTAQGKTNLERSYHVSAGFRVNSPKLRTFTQWGGADPLLTAWELIPLSFVANWFIDIGGYLDAMFAYNGLTFMTAGQGSSYSETTEWETLLGNTKLASSSKSSASLRTPIDFTTLNSFHPVIKTGPNEIQFYDAVALLWSFSRNNKVSDLTN